MLEKILVPLDGSEFGEQALPVARALGAKASAPPELHLAHVHVSIPIFLEGVATVNPELETDREELEKEYLATAALNLEEEWSGSVEWSLLHGPVDAALERYCEEEGIGLVVMSSHGRGGLSRLWLGSVADRLMRRARRPLIILRPDEERPRAAGYELDTILVPLDGSRVSEAALAPARSLALETGARIRILRVLPPFFVVGNPARLDTAEEQREAMSEIADRTSAYVERVAEALRGEGVEAEAKILSDVGSATGILEVARAEGADLIAMATHGRGGLSRALMGSVSDKVVRGAGCPVLLVRPQEDEAG